MGNLTVDATPHCRLRTEGSIPSRTPWRRQPLTAPYVHTPSSHRSFAFARTSRTLSCRHAPRSAGHSMPITRNPRSPEPTTSTARQPSLLLSIPRIFRSRRGNPCSHPVASRKVPVAPAPTSRANAPCPGSSRLTAHRPRDAYRPPVVSISPQPAPFRSQRHAVAESVATPPHIPTLPAQDARPRIVEWSPVHRSSSLHSSSTLLHFARLSTRHPVTLCKPSSIALHDLRGRPTMHCIGFAIASRTYADLPAKAPGLGIMHHAISFPKYRVARQRRARAPNTTTSPCADARWQYSVVHSNDAHQARRTQHTCCMYVRYSSMSTYGPSDTATSGSRSQHGTSEHSHSWQDWAGLIADVAF